MTNTKLWPGFTWALAAIVAASFVAGCGGSRSEQQRQQGDTYFKLEKYEEARQAYESALEGSPDNALAALGLGRTLVRLDKIAEAASAYEAAANSDPELHIARLELANILMQIGRKPDAIANAETLKANSAELGGVLHASLLLRSGDSAGALQQLKALDEQLPDSTLVDRHLAAAYLAAGTPNDAEGLVADATDPANAILQVEVSAAQQAIDAKVSELEQATGDASDGSQTMVLAYAMIYGGRDEEAKSLLQSNVTGDAATGWRDYVIGSYLLANGQREQAAPRLENAERLLPWEPVVMRNAAAMRASKVVTMQAQAPAPQKPAASAPAATEAPSETAAEAPGDLWRQLWQQGAMRQLLARRGEYDPAGGVALNETLAVAAFILGDTAILDEITAKLPDGDPIKSFVAHLKDSKMQEALDALSPLSDGDADQQILGMNATGSALGLSGARAQGVQVLSSCAGRYPAHGASLLNLALVFNRGGMPKYAAQSLRKMTSLFPENQEPHGLLFQILRDAGLDVEARQAAEAMYALFPESRNATMAIAAAYVDAGELELSRTALETYLMSAPNDDQARFLEASIHFREGNPESSLKILEDLALRGELSDGVTTLTALCQAAGEDWNGVIETVAPKNPKRTTAAAKLMLAAAYIQTGAQDKAAELMMANGVENVPGGATGAIVAKALGADIPGLSDRGNDLVEALNSTDGMLVRFAAGAAYEQAKMYEAAYRAYDQIDIAIGSANDYLAERILANVGHVTGAEDVAKAVAERHPNSVMTWLAYATLLGMEGDSDAERAALENAAAAAPEDPRVNMRRGQFFVRQGDPEAAIDAYRAVLAVDPENPVVNNNLAYQLLTSGGDTAEALAAAGRAAKALPNEPGVLHTFGVAQLEAGNLDGSAESLRSALQARPGDPDILFDYARLLIAQGENEAAKPYIESALDSARLLDLAFQRKPEAEQLLLDTEV